MFLAHDMFLVVIKTLPAGHGQPTWFRAITSPKL
jgi:hypothetical protein